MKRTTASFTSQPSYPRRAQTAFSRLAASLAVAACLGAPAVLQAQSDDFNDGDDAGWTHIDPIGTFIGVPQNTWTVVDGKYRLHANPTPDPRLERGRIFSLRPEVYSNFHIAVDVVDWDASKTNAIALAARIGTPGPGTTKGYLFGYISGLNYLDLVRLQDEGTKAVSGVVQVPIVLTPGHGYRLTFTGKGDRFVGRVYELTDLDNPIVEMTGSDGNYADGVSGLAVFPLGASVLGAGDATFDNFAATDRGRPRIAAKIGDFKERLISWPQFEGAGYTLQGTAALGDAAVWTDIIDNVFPDPSGENFFFDAAESTHRFFRLKKSGGAN